jgi:hypothetical protein
VVLAKHFYRDQLAFVGRSCSICRQLFLPEFVNLLAKEPVLSQRLLKVPLELVYPLTFLGALLLILLHQRFIRFQKSALVQEPSQVVRHV